MFGRRLGVLATAVAASLVMLVQPAVASGPMPYGVPSLHVGALAVNAYAGHGLGQWAHTLAGDECTTPGRVALTSGVLELYTNGHQGSCAEVSSPGTFTGGIFEARIKFAAGPGGKVADWPAFWLNGTSWPYYGELDIAEGLHGYLSTVYHYNAAGPNPTSPLKPAYINLRYLTPKPGWYTLDAVWAPHAISVYYNGRLVWKVSSSVIVAKPERIILQNLSGKHGLLPGTAQWMDVAYVRVWRYR